MAFALPDLPCAANALGMHFDAETIPSHHDPTFGSSTARQGELTAAAVLAHA